MIPLEVICTKNVEYIETQHTHCLCLEILDKPVSLIVHEIIP